MYKCSTRFTDGRDTINAYARTGRPRVIDDDTVTWIEKLVKADRRESIRELGERTKVHVGMRRETFFLPTNNV